MATLYDIFNEINNNNKSQSFVNDRMEIIADMDVTVTDDMFVLNVELAGVNKNDIKIEIKDSLLCIQGEKYKSMNNNNNYNNNKNNLQINNDDKPMIEEDSSSSSSSSSNNNNNKSSKTNDKKFISERSFGHFEKYLDLAPVFYQLDLSTINAQFEDGLLTITVRKTNLSNNIKIQIN
ncbi:hypothetical protein ACTFIW_002406 [Dictyostelium discoideum]